MSMIEAFGHTNQCTIWICEGCHQHLKDHDWSPREASNKPVFIAGPCNCGGRKDGN